MALSEKISRQFQQPFLRLREHVEVLIEDLIQQHKTAENFGVSQITKSPNGFPQIPADQNYSSGHKRDRYDQKIQKLPLKIKEEDVGENLEHPPNVSLPPTPITTTADTNEHEDMTDLHVETSPTKKPRTWTKLDSKRLNDWFLQHLEHPYPSDTEKLRLAQETGCTIKQINGKAAKLGMSLKTKSVVPIRKKKN